MFEAFGYIPTTTPLNDLVLFIECIIRGEQISARVSLQIDALGSFARTPGRRKAGFAMSLTMREQKIMG